MNKRQAAIVTAITGCSFGGELFSEFHKYTEEKFGHPIWTHEMASEKFWEKLKELAMPDFQKLIEEIKD